jgi:mono/diheme cytochrome c family protein
MLRRLALVLVALGVAGGFAFWFLTKPKVVLADALGDYTADLANGATMFHAGGCAECHATPGSKDKTKLGGGLALKSPFGTFNVPNVSPDSKHGIGAWTEAQFVTAVMKGTSPSGAHLYPAFPYASYAHMRIEDVRDLFAYMRTLPPVESEVPPHALQFPFNSRRGVGLWKLLYLDERPFSPDPARSEAWNRGAYLVNGPVHCAECHSPRNLLGGIVESQRFDSEHLAEGDRGLVREGCRLHAGVGPDAGRRLCRRLDGGRRAQHGAIVIRRPYGDRDLHQVASAAGRAASQTTLIIFSEADIRLFHA